MSKLFSDPEIDKLIIYALLGVIAVLLIAVLFLAVKKNIYYVNDEGEEIAPVKKPRRRRKDEEEDIEEEEEAPVVAPAPIPVPVQRAKPAVKPILADAEEKEEPVKTKEVPVAPHQADASGVSLVVATKDTEFSKEVTSFPCVLGRDKTVDVVISEPAVSRKHARILNLDGILYIEDIAGHNGTYLNGRKLAGKEQARLQPGDRVNIGRSQITVREILY